MGEGQDLALVLVNIRSAYNVGSILRTAEFFGASRILMVGITPYPALANDQRLPHVKNKLDMQIKKVSLGAESNLSLEHFEDLESAVAKLKTSGYEVVAAEQAERSESIYSFKPKVGPLAILFGEETKGLTKDQLSLADRVVEIDRFGKKESLNVSVSVGVILGVLKQNTAVGSINN
jgi:23S rRNA (guanosine2251-2'-O)-methyltransferase